MTHFPVAIDEATLANLQHRADLIRSDLHTVTARLLQQATQVLPMSSRVVALDAEELQHLEDILGGGSVLNAADLQKKVEQLAGISFAHVRLQFTPQQLLDLADRAERQGLTVTQLVERVAPRVYEQFFDLLGRSTQ